MTNEQNELTRRMIIRKAQEVYGKEYPKHEREVMDLIRQYEIVQEKMDNPVPGLVKGDILNGTLLFADVSGFTALSEHLAALGPEGAEQLTTIMNDYFSAMLDILGTDFVRLDHRTL